MIELLILTGFTIFDPLVAESVLNYEVPPKQTTACVRNHIDALSISQSVLLCLLIGVGCVLCYLIRHVDSKFEDVRALLFAMYNIAFVSIIYVSFVIGLDKTTGELDCVVKTVCIFMATVFSSAALVVPRLIAANKDSKTRHANMRNLFTKSLQSAEDNTQKYAHDTCKDDIHLSDESFKILICSSNMGNAAPTLSSMKAWIPEQGYCDKVTPLEQGQIVGNKFHLIAIGMQEATWEGSNDSVGNFQMSQTIETANRNDEANSLLKDTSTCGKEMKYLRAVGREDAMALRTMEKKVLGPDYISISQETRGQMRLHIYALKRVAPLITNIKVSGANTGIWPK